MKGKITMRWIDQERSAKHFTFFFFIHLATLWWISSNLSLNITSSGSLPDSQSRLAPSYKTPRVAVFLFWSTFNDWDSIMNNVMIFKNLITIYRQWVQESCPCPQHPAVSINNPISNFCVNNWCSHLECDSKMKS